MSLTTLLVLLAYAVISISVGAFFLYHYRPPRARGEFSMVVVVAIFWPVLLIFLFAAWLVAWIAGLWK